MRIRHLIYATGFFAVLTVLSSDCNAQYPGYYSGGSTSINGPTVSPYLNLLQQNRNNVPLYQTLVRPQIEARDAILRQDASLQQLQQQLRSDSFGRARGSGSNRGRTGHQTFFSDYSHYYSRNIRRAIAPY